MSVSDRIRCVENFTKKMMEQKGIVVNLLIWKTAVLRSFSILSLVAGKISDSDKHLLNEIISGED